MSSKQALSRSIVLLTSLGILVLAGCGGGETPAPQASSEVGNDVVEGAQTESASELAAREEELTKREAELAIKEREQELGRREADLAARESAARKSAARAATPTPVKSTGGSATTASTSKAPVPSMIVVPAGTQLSVALASGLSTKTATVGQPFDARLASDVMVEGRRAIPAGTRVTGSVTEVVSGSRKIGGIATLGLRFDSLELANGKRIPISGALVQQAKSDTAKDTAKIVGGTAAGAVIAHQIEDGDRAKLIGGILGGAAGALIAQKTGSEVELPADSVITIALDTRLEVAGS